MSDIGFDTFALAGSGAAGSSHPLAIARELIESGRPAQALELLSEHHDALADDPDYLLACSEAWWAAGDSLRAQQALLGAARLAPDDPTPLVLLAELLRQEGDLEKAARVFERAEALGESPRLSIPQDSGVEEPSYDDLIAAAERKERRTRAGLTPRQIAVAVAGLLFASALVVGIARLTETDVEPDTALEPELSNATTVEPVAELSIEEPPRAEDQPEVQARVEGTDAVEPPAADAPSVDGLSVADPVEPSLPPVPKVTKAAPKRSEKKPDRAKMVPPPSAPAPAPLLSLESDDKEALTHQGDSLHAKGQTGLAATYYRRALVVDADFAPALVGVGWSILRAENYDEVFGNATRALELARGVDSRPGLEAEAIYQLGRVHLHRGDLDAARRLFRQSTSLPRSPAEAWFYLGEALSSDNSPAARAAYEAYLERVPNGHLAERARRAIQ